MNDQLHFHTKSPRRTLGVSKACLCLLTCSLILSTQTALRAQSLTLDDVFNALHTQDAIGPGDYWTRSWDFASVASVEPNTGPTIPTGSGDKYYFWQGRFVDGIRMRSFLRDPDPAGGEPDGLDPRYDSTDSRTDSNAVIKSAYITVQVWFPGPSAAPYSMQTQLQSTTIVPLIVVSQNTTSFEVGTDPPTDPEAVMCAQYLASRGVVFVRWKEGDYIGADQADPTDPDDPRNPLWDQFHFGNVGAQSAFSTQTRDWAKSFGDLSHNGDKSLSLADLRLDYRFALAQGFIVTGTFVQRLVKAYAPSVFGATMNQAGQWALRSKIMYAGGSKDGAAALTAAGADGPATSHNRAVAVRAGGVQAYDLGTGTWNGTDDEFSRLSTFARMETDWAEPLQNVYGRPYHKNRITFKWMYDSAVHPESFSPPLEAPFYANVYVPSQDENRYSGLLFIDDIGASDHLWPLRSSDEWWRMRDGLNESPSGPPNWIINASEPKWDVRHVRGINKDHGQQYDLDAITVTALVVFNGELYSAGLFGVPSESDGLAEHRVAKWNGSAWQSIGGVFNGPVYALAVAGPTGSERLYAGGEFTKAKGGVTSASYLARLNTSSEWESLPGDQFDGPVRALAGFVGGPTSYLCVGGEFQNLGSSGAYKRIACADVTTATPSWTPLDGGLDGPVYSIAKGGGASVYVGGSFVREVAAPNTLLNGIGRWDGSAWNNLQSGVSNVPGVQGGSVQALAYDGTTLFVGGGFTTVVGTSNTKSIAMWSGTSWSSVGSGIDGPVLSLLFPTGSSTLYAGGTFNGIFPTTSGVDSTRRTCRIAKWTSADGWMPLDQGLEDDVLALVTFPSSPATITAGGRFLTAGHYSGSGIPSNTAATLLAQWNPSGSPLAWSAFPAQLAGPIPMNDQVVRRTAEHLLKKLNPPLTSVLPRVDRALFTASGTTNWKIQVKTEDLPATPTIAWRVHVAFSKDRDFRRFDGPSAIPGPVCRTPRSLNRCYPADLNNERYYGSSDGLSVLGENVMDNVSGEGERAPVYTSSRSWEDRFYTVNPKTVTGPDGDGFFELTFDPPTGYPFVLTGEPTPMAACIVEMRVGKVDDGLQDDIAFTEVACANDSLSVYPLYNTENLAPVGTGMTPVVTKMWPNRAKPSDFVYILGDNLFVQPNTDGTPANWITQVGFLSGTTEVFVPAELDNGDRMLHVSARVVRCRVPSSAVVAPNTVKVYFQSGQVAILTNGFTVVSD